MQAALEKWASKCPKFWCQNLKSLLPTFTGSHMPADIGLFLVHGTNDMDISGR